MTTEADHTTDSPIPFPFQGVFSEVTTKSVGFGATKRKEKIKKFWLLERDDEGATFMRPLNSNYLPSGERKTIDPAKSLEKLYPEPNIYMRQVKPRLIEMERAVDRGDEHRMNEELISAEFSYKEALEIDEFHIRANFGLALSYLGMGDKRRARHTFLRIVNLEGAFSEEHKHLFNEFGIALRKHEMYRESLEYYLRALKLCKTDEHLLFNLARACYDNDDFKHANEFIGKALQIQPDFSEGQKLLRAVLKAGGQDKGDNPDKKNSNDDTKPNGAPKGAGKDTPAAKKSGKTKGTPNTDSDKPENGDAWEQEGDSQG